jgi:putative transcriptional regulator
MESDMAASKFAFRAPIIIPKTVFAKLLNVSPSSIRQWEQGKRKPTGSTKVLLEVLEKEPHVLDYRMESNGINKGKAA